MPIIEGYTVKELMEKTGKERHSIEAWLSRHKIEPIIKEFLYPLDTLDRLLKAKRGRPPIKKSPL